jgi:hypothetical protein
VLTNDNIVRINQNQPKRPLCQVANDRFQAAPWPYARISVTTLALEQNKTPYHAHLDHRRSRLTSTNQRDNLVRTPIKTTPLSASQRQASMRCIRALYMRQYRNLNPRAKENTCSSRVTDPPFDALVVLFVKERMCVISHTLLYLFPKHSSRLLPKSLCMVNCDGFCGTYYINKRTSISTELLTFPLRGSLRVLPYFIRACSVLNTCN